MTPVSHSKGIRQEVGIEMEKTLAIHLAEQRDALVKELNDCLTDSLMLNSYNKWDKGWTVGMAKAIAIVKEE